MRRSVGEDRPVVLPMKRVQMKEQPRRRYGWRILAVFVAVVIVVTVQYLAQAQIATERSAILYRLNDLRRELREAKNQGAQLSCQLAELQRPEYINRRLKEYGLQLSVAPVERIIKMPKPVMMAGLPTNEAVYRASATTRPFGTLFVSTKRRE